MDPLLKLAEECAELAQVAIKLSQVKSTARKRKFLKRFLLEKTDVLNALKATRPQITALKQELKANKEQDK